MFSELLLNTYAAMYLTFGHLFLDEYESFISSGVTALKFVVIAVGGGILVLGIIGLLEGYGQDNPGAKSQGMKQAMAGGAIMLVGNFLVPKLNDLIKGWNL